MRPKNSKNILIKNLFDACNGALAFWLVGFGWAYGNYGNDQKGGFIGTDGRMFASSDFSELKENFYLLWTF